MAPGMLTGMIFTRLSPQSAYDFYQLAEEYRQAAQAVFEKLGATSWPGYALAGQAIELHLKAFLRTRGFNTSDLKKLGHDLTRALRKAEENGLANHCKIDCRDREYLAIFSSVYKGKDFNYRSQGTWELPFPSWVLEFTSRLSRAIEPAAVSDLQNR